MPTTSAVRGAAADGEASGGRRPTPRARGRCAPRHAGTTPTGTRRPPTGRRGSTPRSRHRDRCGEQHEAARQHRHLRDGAGEVATRSTEHPGEEEQHEGELAAGDPQQRRRRDPQPVRDERAEQHHERLGGQRRRRELALRRPLATDRGDAAGGGVLRRAGVCVVGGGGRGHAPRLPVHRPATVGVRRLGLVGPAARCDWAGPVGLRSVGGGRQRTRGRGADRAVLTDQGRRRQPHMQDRPRPRPWRPSPPRRPAGPP